jgi:hypothetical protein
MFQTMYSLIVVLFLCLVHLFFVKEQTAKEFKSKISSFSQGISVSYVFLDLLPKLSHGQAIWITLNPGLPFLEKHVYVLALAGLLFFYGIEEISPNGKGTFWAKILAYMLFNFLIGYSLSNPNNPEIKPLILFAIAVGLHFWVKDQTFILDPHFKKARFFLIGTLLLGWTLGQIIQISPSALALMIAFIGGGMLINLFYYEFSHKMGRFFPFMIGSLVYAFFLLFLGNR